ncbi:MAG: cache domain-containing protein, partial [Dorea sp.]|nr:cache domain-containing protein [Dorea sp.]
MKKAFGKISEKFIRVLRLPPGGIQMMITGAFSLVACIVILVLSGIFYNLYSQRLVQMKTENAEQFLNQTKHGLEDYLRSNRRVSDALYYSCIKNKNLEEKSIDDDLNLIYESNKDNIVSISLYSSDGSMISAVPVAGQNEENDISSKEWFLKAKKEVENLHFSMPYVQNISQDALDGYRWVISLARAVELDRGGTTGQGVLVIDMKYSTIQQMIDKVNSEDSSEYIYLCDGNGDIIYHPKRLWMNAGLYEEETIDVASLSDGASIAQIGDREDIIVTKTVSYTGWKLVSVVPKVGYQVGQDKIRYILVFIISVTILSMLLINQQVSRSITKPMVQLDQLIRDSEHEEVTPNFDVKGPSEIV